MILIDNHVHRLIFRIDKNTPQNYMAEWKKVKHDCENGKNEYIVERMKLYCKLEQNKSIPYLKRSEGGIGGDSNVGNKQMRFRMVIEQWKRISYYMDDDIMLHEITNGENEKWSYEELDDLIYALTKTFNYYVGCEGIKGVIEMSSLNDDSDSDNDFE